MYKILLCDAEGNETNYEATDCKYLAIDIAKELVDELSTVDIKMRPDVFIRKGSHYLNRLEEGTFDLETHGEAW